MIHISEEEFDDWARKNRNLKVIYSLTDENPVGWNGEKGRIDRARAMINRHVRSKA